MSMNAPFIPSGMRRRFTTEDVLRMVETGVLHPDERVELIEGELTLMSPKHNRHEWLKNRTVRWLVPRLPSDLILAVESTLYLSKPSFSEPDLLVYPDRLNSEDVRGPDVDLLIEIGDSSLGYDLNTKAPLYADHGVRHYWVMDAQTLTTHVHQGPTAQGGYSDVCQVKQDEGLQFPFAPALSLCLADLK
jgi:Uma2 family endonuclease